MVALRVRRRQHRVVWLIPGKPPTWPLLKRWVPLPLRPRPGCRSARWKTPLSSTKRSFIWTSFQFLPYKEFKPLKNGKASPCALTDPKALSTEIATGGAVFIKDSRRVQVRWKVLRAPQDIQDIRGPLSHRGSQRVHPGMSLVREQSTFITWLCAFHNLVVQRSARHGARRRRMVRARFVLFQEFCFCVFLDCIRLTVDSFSLLTPWFVW